MSLRVIDTSHWKGDIVNTTVDIDGLYTKATEGNYYVDDTCDTIVQWAIKRQKKWGVYHFATNRITDAVTEANYFIDNCEGYVGKGLLILDNENYHWADGTWANDPTNVAWCKAFLDQVYARTGVRALIYMSLSVIDEEDWSPVFSAGYGLIVADYVDNYTPVQNWSMAESRDPAPKWDGVVGDVMWQFTSTGRLDGYNGNLDCNYWYGDSHAWDLYASPQPTPQPTPAPQPTDSPTTLPTPTTPPPAVPEPGTVVTPEPTPPAPSPGTNIDGVIPVTVKPKPLPQPPVEPLPPIAEPLPPRPVVVDNSKVLKATITAAIAAIVAAIAAVLTWLHS